MVALAFGIVAVLVGVFVVAKSTTGPPSPGPVVADEANRVGSTFVANKPFMFGQPVVYNDGDQAARFTSVTLDNPTPGLSLVKVYAAGSRRDSNAIGSSRLFPPRFAPLRDYRAIDGFELAPRKTATGSRGAELILVMRAPKNGTYKLRSIWLSYTVNGQDHRRRVPSSFAACVVPKAQLFKKPCTDAPEPVGDIPDEPADD